MCVIVIQVMELCHNYEVTVCQNSHSLNPSFMQRVIFMYVVVIQVMELCHNDEVTVCQNSHNITHYNYISETF